MFDGALTMNLNKVRARNIYVSHRIQAGHNVKVLVHSLSVVFVLNKNLYLSLSLQYCMEDTHRRLKVSAIKT